jgi:hypothetical protein
MNCFRHFKNIAKNFELMATFLRQLDQEPNSGSFEFALQQASKMPREQVKWGCAVLRHLFNKSVSLTT